MATRTSVGSGLWSAAGTWDTGVPADDDAVVIATGHTVEFDVDQSAFANGINTLTITGTLNISVTVSSYMKIKAGTRIVGAGIFNIGQSGSPIPYAVKFTLTGGASWGVNGASGLRINCYAAEPVIKYIQTTELEPIGETVLAVGTDVTGDLWAAGDTVIIMSHARQNGHEERTIAAGGIAAGSITITAGLTAAKEALTYIVLISRNVMIDASAGVSGTFYNLASPGDLVVAGGLWIGNTASNNQFFTSTATYMTWTGGVIYKGYNQVQTTTYSTFENVIFAKSSYKMLSDGTYNTVTNCAFFGSSYSSIQTGTNAVVTNCLVVGGMYGLWISTGSLATNCLVINCSAVGFINCVDSTVIDCSAINNISALAQNKDSIFKGLILSGNTGGIAHSTGTRFFGCNVGAASINTTLRGLMYEPCEAFDSDGVVGSYRAWTSGGETISQNSVLPAGFIDGYRTHCYVAPYLGYFKRRLVVQAGKSATIDVALRKNVATTILPVVYLTLKESNPEAITPLDTFTMTDSIDTWETDTFSIDNSAGITDLILTLWFVGAKSPNNVYVYSAYKLNMGGGGSVKILPVSGSVGL